MKNGHNDIIVTNAMRNELKVISYNTQTKKYWADIRWGLCGIKFTEKNQQDIHLQTHGSGHPFCCGLCSTKFTDKNQLHIHVQIKHGIEHPFESDESGHAKAKCVDMTDHKETHGIGHQSLCGLCGIEFKANYLLDIHNHTKHGSGQPICCSLCGTKFTNKNQLDIHVHTKQGSRHPFIWGLCGIKFIDKK